VIHRGILVDITRCVGCEACVEACQKANSQRPHSASRFDSETFTFLMKRGEDRYVRRLCMHCEKPTCVSVCPVQALKKTDEGPVAYDPARCLGCRYCLLSCPFSVPTFEWRSPVPRVGKCEMCRNRKGGPACAEACPEQATITGDRKAMILEAKRRIAEGPKTYYQGIYGLREIGGTGVLFIGPPDLSSWGLPVLSRTEPMGDLTWNVLHHVPDVTIFGGVLLGGLWWLTKRKAEVAKADVAKAEVAKAKDPNHD
jgi:formate dehydrogenase iron-sulfur subunit